MTFPFLPIVNGEPRLRVSNSSLGSLRSCPRKFEFRKLFGHPARDESQAAEVGQCLHRGFQDYLIHQDENRALFEMMINYPIHLMYNDSARYDEERSLEACYSTMMALLGSAVVGEYELAHVVCPDGTVKPAVEVPFEIVFRGLTVSDKYKLTASYIGYIDAILFNRWEHKYKVFDIKTHRRKMNDLSGLYQFDEQCLPYGLVLDHVVGEDVASFEVSYLSTYVDLEKPRVTNYSFIKGREEIDDWARTTLISLSQVGLFLDMDWFPRYGGNCMNWNRMCPFAADVCNSRDRDVIQKIILSGEEAKRPDDFEPWITIELEV